MRYLSGDEEKKELEYIVKATEVATNATCERSKCGSLIVRLDELSAAALTVRHKTMKNKEGVPILKILIIIK